MEERDEMRGGGGGGGGGRSKTAGVSWDIKGRGEWRRRSRDQYENKDRTTCSAPVNMLRDTRIQRKKQHPHWCQDPSVDSRNP